MECVVGTFPYRNELGQFNVAKLFLQHISGMLRLLRFRNTATLRPLISEHLLPGSIYDKIFHDGEGLQVSLMAIVRAQF